ncbi:hypothetical protein ABZ611_10685 [Streptomyces sp. NPDC007861]
MLPTRTAADLIGGQWQLLNGLKAMPRALVSDDVAAPGGAGVPN